MFYHSAWTEQKKSIKVLFPEPKPDRTEQGGVHKLRLQDFSFFDHLPPSVYIFYGNKSLQKIDFIDHLPPSSCKRSLWTPPYIYQHQQFHA